MQEILHFYEDTYQRRYRTGGKSHGQALCSTGDAHQKSTTRVKAVTCIKCIELLNKHYKFLSKD